VRAEFAIGSVWRTRATREDHVDILRGGKEKKRGVGRRGYYQRVLEREGKLGVKM